MGKGACELSGIAGEPSWNIWKLSICVLWELRGKSDRPCSTGERLTRVVVWYGMRFVIGASVGAVDAHGGRNPPTGN